MVCCSYIVDYYAFMECFYIARVIVSVVVPLPQQSRIIGYYFSFYFYSQRIGANSDPVSDKVDQTDRSLNPPLSVSPAGFF